MPNLEFVCDALEKDCISDVSHNIRMTEEGNLASVAIFDY